MSQKMQKTKKVVKWMKSHLLSKRKKKKRLKLANPVETKEEMKSA